MPKPNKELIEFIEKLFWALRGGDPNDSAGLYYAVYDTCGEWLEKHKPEALDAQS